MKDVALISLRDVACTFYARKSRIKLRQVEALKNISLDIHEGETLGIIGANGAGKSTFLQVLAQILMPTQGEFYMREGLAVSLLTLQLGFSPDLTGCENAILGAMYLGYTRKEAEGRLQRVLDFAELGAWADEPIRTYSTGMSARLGFAVALEMESDIMLIDEIMGVGDAYFQQKSTKVLLEKMQSGQTTVLVSHSDVTMRSLCSRVVWLHKGTIRMIGDSDDVLDEYGKWVAALKTETAGVV